MNKCVKILNCSKITKAADIGLVERMSFRFLVTGEEDDKHEDLEETKYENFKIFLDINYVNPISGINHNRNGSATVDHNSDSMYQIPMQENCYPKTHW